MQLQSGLSDHHGMCRLGPMHPQRQAHLDVPRSARPGNEGNGRMFRILSVKRPHSARRVAEGYEEQRKELEYPLLKTIDHRPWTMDRAFIVYGPSSTVRKDNMGFLKKLFNPELPKPEKRYYTFQVKCNRCGEIIEGRVDLDNDLSLNDEGDGYIVRKGLMGGNRCFQQIEVELKFDSSRQIQEKTITGGQFSSL